MLERATARGVVCVALSAATALAVPSIASAHGRPVLGQHVAVPAYVPPSDTASWGELSSAGSQLGIVVANPASGPGAAPDSAWESVIDATHGSGAKVIGYVDTGYFGFTGRRTASGSTDSLAWLTQAELDVDRWYSFYGSSLDGIFFDDVENVCGPTAGSDEYVASYRQLNDFVHSLHVGSLTVANPGIAVPQCYEDTADVLLTFEGSAADYLNPSADLAPQPWQLRADPDKFWNIVYDVPQSQLAAVMAVSKHNNAGYIYATPRTLVENPYFAVPEPAYFSTELAASKGSGSAHLTPPLLPFATRVGSTDVGLTWLSIGDRGPQPRVVGYDVYANGQPVGTTDVGSGVTTGYAATNLQPGTGYTFTVRARGIDGTLSAPSWPVIVRTRPAGSTPPTAPAPLTQSSVGPASVTLAWSPSTSANSAIAHYDVYENGNRILVLAPSVTGVTVGGLSPEQTYTFAVRARDDTGATSAMSNTLTITTPAPVGGGVTDPVVTLTSTTATFEATYNLPYTFQNIFIDVDGDSSTGYSVSAGGAQIGADFLIENGAFFSYVGPGFSWGQVADVSPFVSDVDGRYTWEVPTSSLGSGVDSVSVVFNGSGGFADAYTGVVTATLQ
jgi:chitodextrinase